MVLRSYGLPDLQTFPTFSTSYLVDFPSYCNFANRLQAESEMHNAKGKKSIQR